MASNEALIREFATELRVRRTALNLSQEELAHRAGINRTYIAKLELAKNEPTLSILYELAIALKVDLPEMLEAVLVRHRAKQSIKT